MITEVAVVRVDNNKAFTVNAATNQLGVPSGQSGVMSYDAAGNLANDTYTGVGNRTYDGENRITSAWGGNNQAQLYSYDATGQRIKRTVNGVETWQVYGFGGELVAEYAANGAVGSPQKEYGYRNGQLLVTAEPATTVPVNVALAANGATATASSSYSGWGPGGAINGDRKGLFVWQDGVWSTGVVGFPAWLEVQFNGSKTISEIDVITLQDNYNAPIEPTESSTFSLYGSTSYDVQYWNGSAWVTISGGNVSGNNKVWKKFSFSALTTTKIRVLCNASPDGSSRLAEVEAWTGPSPAPRYNLALSATATASSIYDPGHAASAVINGDRKGLNAGNGGNWQDAPPANTFPDWVQIDFGADKTINEVDVFSLQDNWSNPVEPTESMTFTLYGMSGFDVQYWNGSNWVTVPGGNVTGNNRIWKKVTFSPVTTSKIRVLTNAGPYGYSVLTEVEAYAPAEPGGAGSVHWLVADHLGTPRVVLDQTGSLSGVTRHDYLPFGEELFAPTGGRSAAQGYAGGDGVRQQFTSKERDIETGLDYFGERYYANSMGRFTSVDPLGGSMRAGNPQTMNRYAYVLNNPLRYIDPDGLEEKDAWSQLTDEERKALQGKLELKKSETAQQAFNRLVTVGDDSTATTANVQSVQNLIAQAGGLNNSETWQQITTITKVTPGAADLSEPVSDSSRRESSNIEIRVADKDKFLTSLKNDPINKFSVNSLGDAFIKGVGASWHPFDNARAQTEYRSDPQLHYANDKSDDKNYGGNYFFVHWDPTSSNGSNSTRIGNARGGLSHGPMAKIGDVRNYLKRTKQAPR